MGRENVKNIQKNKWNLLLFGVEIQNLGGEISPPKGPEKNTDHIAEKTICSATPEILGFFSTMTQRFLGARKLVIGSQLCIQQAMNF